MGLTLQRVLDVERLPLSLPAHHPKRSMAIRATRANALGIAQAWRVKTCPERRRSLKRTLTQCFVLSAAWKFAAMRASCNGYMTMGSWKVPSDMRPIMKNVTISWLTAC
jgi:hypothetical protein